MLGGLYYDEGLYLGRNLDVNFRRAACEAQSTTWILKLSSIFITDKND
jgi:hypothetical protein